jgi:hypothetical protein
MADLSDVSNALGAIIGAALYPTTPSGEQASPVAGLPVRVVVGWPSPKALDEAMAAGKAIVSIYPKPAERNTTRFPNEWAELSHEAPTYALVISGQTITVSGAAANPYRPQNIAVFLNGAAYTIQTAAGQTAAEVAAALQAAFQADYEADLSGSTITVADARIGPARVGATGQITRELRRQERQFMIVVWAPSPEARDAVAQPVDLALAQIERFTLPDGYSARLTYAGSMINDFDQKQGIFRRDLNYSVEHPTTQADTATDIVVVHADFADTSGNPLANIDA